MRSTPHCGLTMVAAPDRIFTSPDEKRGWFQAWCGRCELSVDGYCTIAAVMDADIRVPEEVYPGLGRGWLYERRWRCGEFRLKEPPPRPRVRRRTPGRQQIELFTKPAPQSRRLIPVPEWDDPLQQRGLCDCVPSPERNFHAQK